MENKESKDAQKEEDHEEKKIEPSTDLKEVKIQFR
jgi:hypothetical protein